MSEARIRDLESQLAQANKRLADDAKRSAIGMALARARVSDPNRVYDAIAAKVTQDHFGRWVVGTDGVAETGPDDGCTYSLDRLVADVAGQNAKPAETSTTETGVILDPKHPRFNYTAATIEARNNPAAHAVLMEHLEYRAGLGRK
ncbi:hypothetical protein [Methylobacterium sp. B1]|uniref:hypothetical protein n=1 Tax=Methylobacterium sp. B1 TaxID=91459 RepID=UPI00034CB75B|nr:hypothetical protein [Methylobacterium sp. B1]